MNKLHSRNHPIIVLIRGLPGSGKTHLSQELQKELGQDNMVMLDPDATNYDSQQYQKHLKKMADEGVDPKIHAYRFLRSQAYEGIAKNKIIVWNQPFTNLEIFNKMVTNFRLQAAKHKVALSILVVEVDVDSTTAKKRVNDRIQAGGHGPSENTFKQFIDDYRSFASEGYNTLTVQGGDDVSRAVASVIKALKDL